MPIDAVIAEIHPTAEGCNAEFRITGVLADIEIPKTVTPERKNNLWKTTCLEIFWQPHGGDFYREFNLSPSGDWACYDFDDVRLNGRDGAVGEVAVTVRKDGNELILESTIVADLPTPAHVALNAIVENKAGNLQYWALAFPDGAPEFHSPDCRTVNLAGPL